MVRHVVRRSKGLPDKRMIHPRREWGIGVILALVLLIVGVGYTSVIYKQFNEIGEDTVGQVARSVRYDAVLVEQAITHYQTQRTVFDAILTGAPKPVATSSEENIEEITTDTDAASDNSASAETNSIETDNIAAENVNEVVQDPDEDEENDEAPVLLES